MLGGPRGSVDQDDRPHPGAGGSGTLSRLAGWEYARYDVSRGFAIPAASHSTSTIAEKSLRP